MSFEYDLISAMRQWDLHVNSLNLEPGKYHRFRSLGTCKTKCCEYRIFENQLGAHFKCFRRGIDRFWFAGNATRLTSEQRLQQAIERDRVTQSRLLAQAMVAERCNAFYEALPPAPPVQHPYAVRKQIYPHGARLARGLCVLPVRDCKYRMQSLQFIRRNGFKQLKAGALAAGGMIWLGGNLAPDYSGVLRICEGWSTGCTIYMLTRSPVLCALNAYNLPKVANLVRQCFIHAITKICADNDQWGDTNTGLEQAKAAQRLTGMTLYYPDFTGLPVGTKPTDFNDLYLIGGAERARRQLNLIRE